MLCQKLWGYFFLEFAELILGIRCIPNPDELVSSAAGLDGLVNGQSHTHRLDLCLSED
jgi:hypothetical protein